MSLSDEVASSGFAIVEGALSQSDCERLNRILGEAKGAGTRDLLKVQEIANIARGCLSDIVAPLLADKPMPVRGIFFDKHPDVNWLVPWHQDLTIAVCERHEVAGFGPWSVKDQIPHVQPPISFLEQMVTARLHLDDADISNGALRVLPGSHAFGRLSADQIRRSSECGQPLVCKVKAGDVMVMRPLLLHASGRSLSRDHRRVVHIEYASFNLPPPLQWHDALALQ
ncbi:MAG: phytanoyl-CoA dioxygenase family protein [Verrucomicrobiaceae bacterium]|nr:phytanoyl-CoA dioxygenase family protein [Verrucomicrobiaceae bacterium]